MRLVMVFLVSACAGSPAPSMTVRSSEPAAPQAQAPVVVARTAESTAGCPLRAPDGPFTLSVVQIPSPALHLALEAAVKQLCSCARPGDRFHAVATLRADRGSVVTHAEGIPEVDACLVALGPASY